MQEESEAGLNETGQSQAGGEPSEEELRRALEEQLKNARVDELLVQSVVSLINLSARRVAIAEERDLGQAKLGIDAVRALVDLLPAEVAGQVRDALSQLQLQFAQVSGATPEGEGGPGGQSEEPDQAPQESASRPRDSGLWTPPGSV